MAAYLMAVIKGNTDQRHDGWLCRLPLRIIYFLRCGRGGPLRRKGAQISNILCLGKDYHACARNLSSLCLHPIGERDNL